MRTMTSHRSDLNSLASSTNNGTANGLDDHSESSESTSGCSSLTPQTNRHEGPSNLLQQIYNSPFSNRKRHIDDKLTFSTYRFYTKLKFKQTYSSLRFNTKLRKKNTLCLV